MAPGQKRAYASNTNIECTSSLNMYSTANKMRLSGIVCTIGARDSPRAHRERDERRQNELLAWIA